MSEKYPENKLFMGWGSRVIIKKVVSLQLFTGCGLTIAVGGKGS